MTFLRHNKGITYTNPDSYYGAVYEDIVEYSKIDVSKIKSDADLQRILGRDPKISQKLIDKLQDSSVHREIVQQNIEEEGIIILKNKRRVKTQLKDNVMVYKDIVMIGKTKRTRFRNVKTGRFA